MADFFANEVGDNDELGRIICKILNEKVTTDLTYKRLPIGYLNRAATLNAIVSFCSRIRAIRSHPCYRADRDRIEAVITLNYDCFLEAGATTKYNAAPLKPMTRDSRKPGKFQLPVYHVHGYAPYGSFFKITSSALRCLRNNNLPGKAIERLQGLLKSDPVTRTKFLKQLNTALEDDQKLLKHTKQILQCARTDRHPKHPLVMTSESYEQAYDKGGYAADNLDSYLSRYTTLFIGTSFDDRLLIDKLKKMATGKSPEHFTLIPDKDSGKIIGRLSATRVSPIVYQQHEDIPPILGHIYKAALGRKASIPKEDNSGKIIGCKDYSSEKYWNALLKNKK
jgi:hypothetical protein